MVFSSVEQQLTAAIWERGNGGAFKLREVTMLIAFASLSSSVTQIWSDSNSRKSDRKILEKTLGLQISYMEVLGGNSDVGSVLRRVIFIGIDLWQ